MPDNESVHVEEFEPTPEELDEAKRHILARRRGQTEDSTQPVCTCNAATVPHRHLRDGVKLV